MNVKNKALCYHPKHVLILVYSGELIIQNGSCKITVKKGEYIFLRKDIHTILIKKDVNGQPFQSISLGFSESFLREFFYTMNKCIMPKNFEYFKENIIKLPKTPYIDSLYISLIPYLDYNIQPIKNILELKLTEALLTLLLTDKRFYSCLFDLDQSETTNIQESQYRNYYISKQLETSYIKLNDENKTTDVYIEARYKNICCFINTIEKQYDLTFFN